MIAKQTTQKTPAETFAIPGAPKQQIPSLATLAPM